MAAEHPCATFEAAPPALTELRITVRVEPDRTVVEVEGEVDLWSARSLRARLEAAEAESVTDVIVDLAGVTFFDSSGIAVLAMAHGRLAARHRSLEVRRAPTMVRRVLEIAGVDGLLVDGAPAVASPRPARSANAGCG